MHSTLKSILFLLGVVSVILGVIGIFLPVMPTTPFLILAAWCFVRSSERAHQWLHRQPVFGKALQDWEQNRAIARRTKILAISMILISCTFIWFKVDNLWVQVIVTTILACAALFIATRNEHRTRTK